MIAERSWSTIAFGAAVWIVAALLFMGAVRRALAAERAENERSG